MNYRVNDYNAKYSKTLDASDSKLPLVLMYEAVNLIFDTVSVSTEAEKLSKSEIIILMYLYENPGVVQLNISKATHFQPPTVSLKLKKMEKNGLVMRVTDKYDRRAIRVYSSERGQNIIKALITKLSEVKSQVLNGISNEELIQLTATLSKMVDNIK